VRCYRFGGGIYRDFIRVAIDDGGLFFMAGNNNVENEERMPTICLISFRLSRPLLTISPPSSLLTLPVTLA